MTRVARKYNIYAAIFEIGTIAGIRRYNVAKLFYIVRKKLTFFSFLINRGLVRRYNKKKEKAIGLLKN